MEDAPTLLLVEAIERLNPGAAIDLACGTGRNALYLADHGWDVTAIDGSARAIDLLRERSAAHGPKVHSRVADLTASEFELPCDTFDLVLIAFYFQRDLISKAKKATRPGALLAAIAHLQEPGAPPNEKWAASGELRRYFSDWDVLWEYEGPSRDPAHRRPVTEILARRTPSSVV